MRGDGVSGYLSLVLAAFSPGAGLASFLALFSAVVLGLLTVLVFTWGFFTVMNRLRPDHRIQPDRENRQIAREMRQAPGSIASIAFCFAGGLFAQGQGWALTPLPLSWWSVPLTLAASVLLYDAWFYWVHRLLHVKPFTRFHRLHHTSITPTIWTNHNETLVEALLNQSFFFLLVFVLPIHPVTLIAHKIYDQFSGMLGHAGYEHFASPMSRTPFPLASTIFHDQHHSSYRYNYAHTFSFWDRWLGTLHPDYDRTVARFEGPAPAGEPAQRQG